MELRGSEEESLQGYFVVRREKTTCRHIVISRISDLTEIRAVISLLGDRSNNFGQRGERLQRPS